VGGTSGLAERGGLRGAGVPPALSLYKECAKVGINEVSCYGFTEANTHRPRSQVTAFQRALVSALDLMDDVDASVLVVGDASSKLFPDELRPYTRRTAFNRGTMKVNVLVNYSW
jgi:undecaprenyl diphosphate synthase